MFERQKTRRTTLWETGGAGNPPGRELAGGGIGVYGLEVRVLNQGATEMRYWD